MKALSKKRLGILLLLVLCAYWLVSEAAYARSKQPTGIQTIEDYHQRFGDPLKKRVLYREGKTFQEYSGRLPRWPWFFAFPSSRPAYVFDESGQFVEWCTDPADSHEYQKRWRQKKPEAPDSTAQGK